MANTIFNPVVDNYRELLNSDFYVDKTDLIFELNKRVKTPDKYICVTMPKYFGKSVIVNMLTTYYSYSQEKLTIFNEEKIGKIYGDLNKDKKEANYKYLNEFNVITLKIKDHFSDYNIEEGINIIKKTIIREVKKTLNNFNFWNEDNIVDIFEDIYNETKRKFVFIIDDWDFVIHWGKFDGISLNNYFKFLTSFFKNKNYTALAYVTGILPIKMYKLDCDLIKIFTEFSMTSPKWMAKYIGFTDDEVKELCEKKLNSKIEDNTQNTPNKKQKLNNESHKALDEKTISKDENLIHKNKVNYEKIKNLYSGYELVDSISDEKYMVYSPYSIKNVLNEGKIENYQMNNCSIFFKIVQKNFNKLKDVLISLIKLERIKINSLVYQNDMTTFEKRKEKLIMLVHLGYLNYDRNTEEIFIPNKEILQIFESFIQTETWEILNIKSKIFNPGEDEFCKILNSSFYIDKTELILYLNKKVNIKNENCVCISRPRHFGKTVTADMITAYYSYTESRITAFDDKKLTENDNWDKYFGKFNVIKLNMSDFFSKITKNNEREVIDIDEGIEKIKNSIVSEVQKSVPNFKYKHEYDIEQILSQIEKDTGSKIVLIIDECDFVIRFKKFDKKSYIKYLNFLTFIIKDKQCIALVYMTGILPIQKCGNNSSVASIFEESSMTSPKWMAKYIGFTDEEIKMLLFYKINLNNQTQVDNIKNSKNLNKIKLDEKMFDEFKKMKKWYNGYQLIDVNNKIYEIYSPLSIKNTIKYHKLDNYWIKTEQYMLLKDYIEMDFDGLKEDVIVLIGLSDDEKNRVKININGYQNDMITFRDKDDILTMLVHLGYLAYDSNSNEVFIPNKEVREDFIQNTKSDKWTVSKRQLNLSEELLEATIKGDEKLVTQLLEDAYDDSTNIRYHNKASLSASIQLAYHKATDYYIKLVDIDSGKGFIDLFYLPYNSSDKKYPPIVVEMKYNKKADTGIKQIKRNKYPKTFENYYGVIILVCISYKKDKKTNHLKYKRHSCIIERHMKEKQ